MSGHGRPRCHHPGCERPISTDSKTGMCRNHVHKPGCHCKQCRGLIIRYRIKTRAEFQAEGLLPQAPLEPRFTPP